MLCPQCNVVMEMAFRDNIEIDYCPKCRGIWLDRGELDKLLDRTMDERRSQHFDDEDSDEFHV
ncbi:MAG: zf-TFIIB domain-containing protein, partial [Aggregatilineales bacterium]